MIDEAKFLQHDSLGIFHNVPSIQIKNSEIFLRNVANLNLPPKSPNTEDKLSKVAKPLRLEEFTNRSAFTFVLVLYTDQQHVLFNNRVFW